ncbi:ABC transporter permease [Anaeromyxobacter sp. Fw109-5]|uniref:PhnE/PtxC family ABC transporter permease n=1 Tax=Anaeromyxobacter sp. (strain Fw109-5) TaxID=404589 RepID=UPI0000ED8A01|nr:ABC transporter permease subunit [Anaeromyxobacter sp. Fw109-5]ABS27217.1 phosphonate ABC transporter, inner membrane subunit [Anaeromyxobacter sp. Fw109-5]
MSPRRPPLPALLSWPGLALAAAVGLSYRLVDGDLRALLAADARRAMSDLVRGFWPPAHSPEFLSFLVRPLAETVAIAFLGMSLALALAAPLAFLAASPRVLSAGGERTPWPRRAAWLAARVALNLMRSVPELVWALVLVRAFGLGPLAGVLAIGIGYAGVLGKVFAEIFESAPRAPAAALAGAGAPPASAFAFGVLPSTLPLLASYALYRFDCALRAAAVLGLVGAGGVGVQLELSLKMFAYDEVAAMVIALFALVAGVDLLSQRVRRRIHLSRGLFPLGLGALRLRLVAVAAWVVAAFGAARVLALSWRDVLSPGAFASVGALAGAMWPPDLDPAFLRQLAPAALVTLATSVLGTAIAALVGLLLAYPAAYRIHAVDGSAGGSAAGRAAVAAAAWLARGLMNLGRTLPELLWALVLIFAVGLGPFAGALALGIHTAGVLGRLYAEALEEVPLAPSSALRESGAGDAAASIFAVLPQAFPQLVAYTLYRWEVNIRASAVLGVVGAGGLGGLLHVSLNLFHHHRTLTLLAVTVLLVTGVDLLSGAIRRRILEGPPAEARRAPETPVMADAW